MRIKYLAIAGLATFAASIAASGPRGPRYRDVQPILRGVCGQCHKGANAAHGLDLTNYASTIRGDKKGKVVNARYPEKSRLATVLHGKPQLMPPGGELSRPQIKKIEDWIRGGAKN